ELDRLAKHFKVSTLVILRRVLDAGFMSRERFSREYRVELKRVLGFAAESRTGGNYYPTQVLRVSRRFALALVESTLEGQTLYRDALRLAGCKKVDTFHKLGEHLRSA